MATRDQQIALAIGIAQEAIGNLRADMLKLVADAEGQGATGHAGLYQAVADDLFEAWKFIGDAYEVMEHADPEDYA